MTNFWLWSSWFIERNSSEVLFFFFFLLERNIKLRMLLPWCVWSLYRNFTNSNLPQLIYGFYHNFTYFRGSHLIVIMNATLSRDDLTTSCLKEENQFQRLLRLILKTCVRFYRYPLIKFKKCMWFYINFLASNYPWYLWSFKNLQIKMENY